MRLISHRGNVDGKYPQYENLPEYVDKALNLGYDVEVDLWIDNDGYYLGHDEPTYPINLKWLTDRYLHLWIHCKDVATLHEFSTKTSGYNFFFHDKDDYTLTSKQYIWAYPGKSYTDHTVMVMPEWKEDVDWDTLRATNCFGICTDYPQRLI